MQVVDSTGELLATLHHLSLLAYLLFIRLVNKAHLYRLFLSVEKKQLFHANDSSSG